MLTVIDQISQKLPQASDAVLQKVLEVLNAADDETFLESVGAKVRDHSAFLNGYAPEDDSLYGHSDDVLPVVKSRRVAPPSIAGKGRTLGDIVSPIVDEQDWECLK